MLNFVFLLLCQAYIAGATAPQFKWKDEGVKLRFAVISLAV